MLCLEMAAQSRDFGDYHLFVAKLGVVTLKIEQKSAGNSQAKLASMIAFQFSINVPHNGWMEKLIDVTAFFFTCCQWSLVVD